MLVTGATGFLGQFLIPAGIKSGLDLTILTRPESKLHNLKTGYPHVGSILNDYQSVRNYFLEKRPDVILHLATNYGRNDESISQILDANLSLPVMLLDLAKEFKVRSFISVDSFFNKPGLSYGHLHNYSLSKKSLSNWFPYFARYLQIYNVLLEHVYGPNDSLDKFVPQMFDQIATRKVEEVQLTPGEQIRDFIYVEDVANALVSLCVKLGTNKFSAPGYETLSLGTGIGTSIRDFTEIIKSQSESPTVLNFGALQYRTDEIMESVGNKNDFFNSEISAETTDVLSGIAKILAAMRDE